VRNCAPGNLAVPGSVLTHRPGTTVEMIDNPRQLAQKPPARGPVSAREAFRDPWSCL